MSCGPSFFQQHPIDARAVLDMLPLALKLSRQSPCDPKPLNRAARDYVDKEPRFALGVAMASLLWQLRRHNTHLPENESSLLFVMGGVNNGLRSCDLLRLKVGRVRGLKPGDTVTIKESKTGSARCFGSPQNQYGVPAGGHPVVRGEGLQWG